MADWNPSLYLRFGDERTWPVRDLIARIRSLYGGPENVPKRILDIGCGPGNSTRELLNSFPGAEVTGLDSSETMIERARADCPGADFIAADASGDLSALGSYDLVFSNAALQWMPRHDELLRRFAALLPDGGMIAAQVPQSNLMPTTRAVDEAAREPLYAGFFSDFKSGMHYNGPDFYYDVLCGLGLSVELWSTEYFHVMQGHDAIIEWISSTGMRPYLERLPKEAVPGFTERVKKRLEAAYPKESDGKVLFPFKRLFFVAHKARP